MNIPFKFLDITQGDKARLLSPLLLSGSARCLQFYYFMGGTFVGELIVYTQKNGQPIWQLIGDQGRDWKKGVIPLQIKEKTFQVQIACTVSLKVYLWQCSKITLTD